MHFIIRLLFRSRAFRRELDRQISGYFAHRNRTGQDPR